MWKSFRTCRRVHLSEEHFEQSSFLFTISLHGRPLHVHRSDVVSSTHTGVRRVNSWTSEHFVFTFGGIRTSERLIAAGKLLFTGSTIGHQFPSIVNRANSIGAESNFSLFHCVLESLVEDSSQARVTAVATTEAAFLAGSWNEKRIQSMLVGVLAC